MLGWSPVVWLFHRHFFSCGHACGAVRHSHHPDYSGPVGSDERLARLLDAQRYRHWVVGLAPGVVLGPVVSEGYPWVALRVNRLSLVVLTWISFP